MGDDSEAARAGRGRPCGCQAGAVLSWTTGRGCSAVRDEWPEAGQETGRSGRGPASLSPPRCWQSRLAPTSSGESSLVPGLPPSPGSCRSPGPGRAFLECLAGRCAAGVPTRALRAVLAGLLLCRPDIPTRCRQLQPRPSPPLLRAEASLDPVLPPTS